MNIPIETSLIVSLVLGFLMWLLKRAIDAKEKRLAGLEADAERLKRIVARTAVDVAVLKSQTAIDLRNLDKLDEKLDRLIEGDK